MVAEIWALVISPFVDQWVALRTDTPLGNEYKIMFDNFGLVHFLIYRHVYFTRKVFFLTVAHP